MHCQARLGILKSASARLLELMEERDSDILFLGLLIVEPTNHGRLEMVALQVIVARKG